MASALPLPTFLIGPQSRGRDYGVIAESGDGLPSEFAYRLAMMLLDWAKDQPSQDFIALLPAGRERSVLFRAAYRGEGELGPLAYLQGCHFESKAFAGRFDLFQTIASRIPTPDGSREFAQASLQVASSDQPLSDQRSSGVGEALAWKDVVLQSTQGQREADLFAALVAIRPEVQKTRVTGFATALPAARESFDLAKICQFLVLDQDEAAHSETRLANHSPLSSDQAASASRPPENWHQWRTMLETAESNGIDISGLHWSRDYLSLGNEQLAERFVRRASTLLSSDRMMRLLLALWASDDAPSHAAAAKLLPTYLEALAKQGASVGALEQMLGAATSADDHDLALIAAEHANKDALIALDTKGLTSLGELLAQLVRKRDAAKAERAAQQFVRVAAAADRMDAARGPVAKLLGRALCGLPANRFAMLSNVPSSMLRQAAASVQPNDLPDVIGTSRKALPLRPSGNQANTSVPWSAIAMRLGLLDAARL